LILFGKLNKFELEIQSIKFQNLGGKIVNNNLYFSDHNRIKFLNGKTFRTFTNLTVHFLGNDCTFPGFETKLGTFVLRKLTEKCGFVEQKIKKPSHCKGKPQTTLAIIILVTVNAVLFCIVVVLVLCRKFCDKKSAISPLPRKKTTLADLTISSIVITEIEPCDYESNKAGSSNEAGPSNEVK
jgi:hypothetical protein